MSLSAHLHPESYYQQKWCTEHRGQLEYKLDDGTRVDCLTDEYAVEVEFAPKWAEAVGQSLYYSYRTGKRAAVVLIIEQPKHGRYLERLKSLSKKHNIIVFTIKP